MYFNNLNLVITKNIREYLDKEICSLLIESILEQKKKYKLDYLQVFYLTTDTENKNLFIRHTQEKTENTEEFEKFMILKTENFKFEEFDNVVYLKDDITHQTILFSFEN
ncbi:MAG: DUF960 family protein [Plesiomonas shigelloides]